MYHHEQVGKFFIVTGSLLIAPLLLGIATKALFLVYFALIIAVVYCAFARLTIDVRHGNAGAELCWAMTLGWPRGCIPIAAIAGVTIVPVRFWMGIGIHLTLRGWVWNVSLGKGVRIVKRDGSHVILGTDDPEGLVTAIARAA